MGFLNICLFLSYMFPDHPDNNLIPSLISVKKEQQAEYKRVRDVFASVKIGDNDCIQKKLYKSFELSNAGEFGDKCSYCITLFQ